MDNNSNHVRIRALPVVEAFAVLPGVKGIVCFGSCASGTDDEYSDIDLYVFCHPTIIPASERQTALQWIKGISDVQLDHVEFSWEDRWNPCGDRFKAGNCLFDVSYNTVDWIRTVVRKVTADGAISIPELPFRPYTMLGLLDSSVILYDPERSIRELKDMVTPYPSHLKEKLIADNLCIYEDSLEELQDYVQRGIGNTAFQFDFRKIIDAMTQLLFALNDRYDPAAKRTEAVLRTLPIVPDNFMERYEAVLASPLTPEGRKDIVRTLRILLEEIKVFI